MNQQEKDYLDKITGTFHAILKGKTTNHIDLPESYPDDEIRQVISYANRFIAEYKEFADFMYSLANGELDYAPPKGKMRVLQSFKTLQASLRHLTWKTQQIAAGDFDQRVDFMGDFSSAFNSMTEQLKEAFEKIEKQNEELKAANETIRREKEKADKLLLNILPVRVADDLKKTGTTKPQTFENVTVYFSDIVGFTHLSPKLEPKVLIDELNEIFTAFDNIIEKNSCERIKTIGDAYLAVCGMPSENESHAENILKSAIEIIDYLNERNKSSKVQWEIRIGIHTGRVVGGVVGIKKYIYDVFGDTINMASRMESNSEPMRINISETTYNLVKDKFEFVERDLMEVKGKGKLKMFFVEGEKKGFPESEHV